MNWTSFFETITDDPASVTPVSEAAFCRARKKLKPEALVTLNNVLLDSANQQIAQQPPPALLCDLLIGRIQQNIVQCDQCLGLELFRARQKAASDTGVTDAGSSVMVSKNWSSSSRLVPLRKFSNSGTSRCKGKARSRVKSRSERRACCKNRATSSNQITH